MKTTTYFLAIVTVVICMCQACSVATSVHFNKNYSGTYQTIVDMSEFISMAGMFDTTGTVDPVQMIAEMRHKLDSMQLDDVYNGLSGIRDAEVGVSDEGVISIAFKFDNIESLNASFKTMKERTAQSEGMDDPSMDMIPTDLLGGGDQVIERDGKTVTFAFNSEAGLGEALAGEDDGDLDMISSMVDFTIDLSFDRKIKSVEVEGVTVVEQNKNLVKTRADFTKMISEGKYSIRIKTK